jgi:hypothetical protein
VHGGFLGLLIPSSAEVAMDRPLRCVFIASGEIQAQQVRAFLEGSGVRSTTRGESLRLTHGLTLDGLGAVEILVPETDVELARTLLASAESGDLRLTDTADPPPFDSDSD